MAHTDCTHRDVAEPSSQRALWPALGTLIALSVADAALSSALLHHGLMREANPLVRVSLANLGLPATLGLKLAVTVAAAGLLVGVRRELAGVLPKLLWAACFCYALLWAAAFFLG